MESVSSCGVSARMAATPRSSSSRISTSARRLRPQLICKQVRFLTINIRKSVLAEEGWKSFNGARDLEEPIRNSCIWSHWVLTAWRRWLMPRQSQSWPS